ncbi:MAG: N-acetylmuramoyl-L-alanine amidase [Terriglobia bacterium]
MTTFLRRRATRRFIFPLAVISGVLLLLWPARRAQSENFVFYLPNQRKLIPMEMIGNTPYLPLIPVLSLRGPLSGLQEKRNSLKVWLGADQLQFHLNRNKIEINSNTAVTLPEPVVRSNGQWMAPVSFLTGVMARLGGEPILYRAGASRAFVGNVHPISYTVRLAPRPAGARLLIQFTGKVTAASASSNGKWILYLGGAAIEPLEPDIRFDNPYIKELKFDDQDGRPKLIITAAMTGLNFYPVMTSTQQELVADFELPPGATLPPSATAANHTQGAGAAANTTQPQAAGAQGPGATPPAPAAALPVIVLDAGHGGTDSGARSREGVLEKNLDAAIVQQVASAIAATRKYRVVLTRSGDSDPTIEQRTLAANTSRPVAFVTFHAGQLGDHSPVIRVYTYQPSSPSLPTSSTPPPPSQFVRWDEAQQPSDARSQRLAADLARRLAAIQGATVPPPVAAPVRQLRSVAAPAAAIELGTLAPADSAGVIAQPVFQQQVAAAVVAALQEFASGGPAQ